MKAIDRLINTYKRQKKTGLVLYILRKSEKGSWMVCDKDSNLIDVFPAYEAADRYIDKIEKESDVHVIRLAMVSGDDYKDIPERG